VPIRSGFLARRPDAGVRIFLLGDAVGRAVAGQKVPDGYYHLDRMIAAIPVRRRACRWVNPALWVSGPCRLAGSDPYRAGCAGRVSYMRAATTRPEAAVSAATTQIAARIPNASAVAPASRAPMANPPSRHRR
jgi:hypothetical protein